MPAAPANVTRTGIDRDPARVLRRLEALRAQPDADGLDALIDCIWGAHRHNLVLLWSLAALCLELAQFEAAQRALFAACRLAPTEPSGYRWLGELRLRRGDARRAELALRHAQRLGSDDPTLELWLQRSVELRALQRTHGRREVARWAAREWPVPPDLPRDAALPVPCPDTTQPPPAWIATPTPTHPGWPPAPTPRDDDGRR